MSDTQDFVEATPPLMGPLPLGANGACFADAEDYVKSLLSFVTSNVIFQTLCGGVHILDFLTKEPDLYSSILPLEWRLWFESHKLPNVLDLLLKPAALDHESKQKISHDLSPSEYGSPPQSLLHYITAIRKHALERSFRSSDRNNISKTAARTNPLPRHVVVGMKPKKIHEVQSFVSFVDDLIVNINESASRKITHLVDFGSGQNYLGRALASPPYSKKVVALESKTLNITGAKRMDVTAKLVEKKKVMRNKKNHRIGLTKAVEGDSQEAVTVGNIDVESSVSSADLDSQRPATREKTTSEESNIQYIETLIEDGDLSKVISQIQRPDHILGGPRISDPQLMVISLHSCGNLLHHGLRSLMLNPCVKAVAMVGCCYNLVTERLGPPTFKVPSLRFSNQRLEQTSTARDPHGFPMSERLATYQYERGHGVRMNITARMMAVQAPENWTDADCESFFTRHFYRALLQRILLDRGVVGVPRNADSGETSPRGWTGAGPALTIGSLRKAYYASFQAYVRGAITKLANDPARGSDIAQRMKNLTDEEIQEYEARFSSKKKELSIVWSLMAFSATVVESTIVVDRWLYLKEQREVKDCWVESVFDYKQSPRNLVVVGIKQ